MDDIRLKVRYTEMAYNNLCSEFQFRPDSQSQHLTHLIQ